MRPARQAVSFTFDMLVECHYILCDRKSFRRHGDRAMIADKLGAFPQLECWNNGIMGFMMVRYGTICIISAEDIFHLKTNIPIFHYSMIEARTQT